VSEISRRSRVPNAASISPCTDRSPLGWRAQPPNRVPSYSISRRVIDTEGSVAVYYHADRITAVIGLVDGELLDELEVDHLGRVRPPRPKLEDPRVAARALGIAGSDLFEELVDDELILTERC